MQREALYGENKIKFIEHRNPAGCSPDHDGGRKLVRVGWLEDTTTLQTGNEPLRPGQQVRSCHIWLKVSGLEERGSEAITERGKVQRVPVRDSPCVAPSASQLS